ncbi:FG-GAP repeat protein [Enhygromyxa salina]|uniref:FG-GAP repeat protein n=2 Tax=Enhygromyxa salina TaxID=215803 RepID=A0A2S9YLF1_9BACT|nr:FG-GAP repeat protein [Enhygromyxa salina]
MAAVPDYESVPPVELCKVFDNMNAVGECDETAPPDAFEPDVQWSWWGPDGKTESFVPALVANLTDDNEDGEIDLCDTPDVVVVAANFPFEAHIYVLDGATGALHFQIPPFVAYTITPAIGDIDGDGLPEIVAGNGPGFGGPAHFMAFEHDGTHKWTASEPWEHAQGGSIALADLDNDGDVEIMGGQVVLDHLGQTVFVAPDQIGLQPINTAVTAADLDGDGDLEVVLGQSAYHHDGAEVYFDIGVTPGFPQVANLDEDPEPEILVTNNRGLTLLEHDGAITYVNVKPDGIWTALRPAAIHDFDGDGLAEFSVSSASVYSVFEPAPSPVWSALIDDSSGSAGGTAFDFNGDGRAEAMYADEQQLFIFDDLGAPLLTVPRSARTLTEYPTVADVDNDGSAEIIVVSDAGFDEDQTAPTVQVIRDVEDRWIQARRIWNQHTYHVTNVREDGTIPQWEQPNWATLNTFRTNAQIEGGEICKPEPVG